MFKLKEDIHDTLDSAKRRGEKPNAFTRAVGTARRGARWQRLSGAFKFGALPVNSRAGSRERGHAPHTRLGSLVAPLKEMT